LPYLVALVRAGWLVACLIALREGSDPVLCNSGVHLLNSEDDQVRVPL
jgi:hypothetical protein